MSAGSNRTTRARSPAAPRGASARAAGLGGSPRGGEDAQALRVGRLEEEIRLYAHYRVAKALARKSGDPAGAYTAGLNAGATWGEIRRLLKVMRRG